MTRDDYLTAIDGLDGKRIMIRINGGYKIQVIHGVFRYDRTMPYICKLQTGKREFIRLPYAQIAEIRQCGSSTENSERRAA